MVKRYICGCPDPGEHWVGERYVLASDFDGIAAELAECRNSRQREHDLRVTLAGELESFKIRYQDEVNARVNAENELDAVRSGFVAELRKAKAALAGTRMAFLHQSGLLAQARELLARYGTLSEWDKDYAPAIDAFLGSPSRPDNLSSGTAEGEGKP